MACDTALHEPGDTGAGDLRRGNYSACRGAIGSQCVNGGEDHGALQKFHHLTGHYRCRWSSQCRLNRSLNSSRACLSSSTVSKVRTHNRCHFSVRMQRSATPVPSGARTKLGLDSIPRSRSSYWNAWLMYWGPKWLRRAGQGAGRQVPGCRRRGARCSPCRGRRWCFRLGRCVGGPVRPGPGP